MRIFHGNTEITKNIERLDNNSHVISYTLGDYIYLASDFPFNHFYIKLGDTVNAVSNSMSIQYYGSSWNSSVELTDESSGLFSSGFVSFTPNKSAAWTMVSDSTELGLTKVVYNKYWARISFNATLTASISLSFIGNKFSDDTDLFSEFPIFDDANYLTSFKAGKLDWEEQHIKAAELIVSDLQKKGVIIAKEQVLDRKKFLGASVCKVAELLFTAFGNDYVDQRKAAKEEYSKRLDLSQFSVDANNNAILEPSENKTKQGWISR